MGLWEYVYIWMVYIHQYIHAYRHVVMGNTYKLHICWYYRYLLANGGCICCGVVSVSVT